MVRFLLIVLAAILALIAVFRINTVRYAAVRAVWKVIDWVSMKIAAKAILPEGVKVETDLPYIKGGTSEQLLDVYYPENSNDKLPVIIFIHGGGFIAGDKKHTMPYCRALAKEGYTVYNINYRLAPNYENPAQIMDVLAAMMWVEENCEKHFGDKSRIVLAGDSVGAYMAGLAACVHTNENLASRLNYKSVLTENQIKGVLLFSGVYDLETGSKTGFPSIQSDIGMFLGTDDIKSYENLNDFSVTRNVTSKFPKAFISSGAVDKLHAESIELISVLDKSGVYHKDFLFDKNEKKAMHDYQFHMELDISKLCMKSVIEFLKTAIG